MNTPSLNLIVLRAADPARLVTFYDAIGMTFVAERHGNGPEHHAAQLGGIVVEIYPQTANSGTTEATVIGFTVNSLDDLAPMLEREARIISDVTSHPWGRSMIVRDPAGHRLHLTEAT